MSHYLKKADETRGSSLGIGAAILVVCLMFVRTPVAMALGTRAGTVIRNTVTVSYTLDSNPAQQTVTAADGFAVLEIIDATAVWQDAGPVDTGSPQTGRVLTFLLTNTGNGPETYRLFCDNAVGGDDFDPHTTAIWLEVNAIEGLQTTGSHPDRLYLQGVNDPELTADTSRQVYVVGDIAAGLADGDTGRVALHAAALTPGAAEASPGTLLPGSGIDNAGAVVGASGARASARGSYTVSAVQVALTKSIARVTDADGENRPFPGARVTYRIAVAVSGSGIAENLVITDAVPADMAYVPDSIVLDGIPQTDADDPVVDGSDYNVTRDGTVSVNLGNVAAPAAFIIEFETTIN